MLCKAKRQKFLTRREIEGRREEEGREGGEKRERERERERVRGGDKSYFYHDDCFVDNPCMVFGRFVLSFWA